MIAGYVQKARIEDAWKLFNEMWFLGLPCLWGMHKLRE